MTTTTPEQEFDPHAEPSVQPEHLATPPRQTNRRLAFFADQRSAARDTYREQLSSPRPITGAELGRQFGLSPRWGQYRAAEERTRAELGVDVCPGKVGTSTEPDLDDKEQDPGRSRTTIWRTLVELLRRSVYRVINLL